MIDLSISVVIPVKNESQSIAACLDKLKSFDDIWVVDSNSTDGTRKIVQESQAYLVDFHWNGKFPKKRNWTLDNVKLKHDWVLFLDADEFIDTNFISELKMALTNTTNHGFWITYQNHFLGKPIRGDRFTKLALFRRSKGRYERIDEDHWSHLDMEIHEHAIIEGPVGQLNTPISHRDFRGLEHYIDKHNQYSSWEAQRYLKIDEKNMQLTSRQRVKHHLIDTWLLAPLFFIYLYLLRLGFLDGRRGWMFSLLKAQYFYQIKMKIEEARVGDTHLHD
jgi:glycosyltransferase involved in cell wall biosynthesis